MRKLRKYFVALVIFVAIFTANCLFSHEGCKKTKYQETSAQEVKDIVTYTCPMHPDVVSDKPGKCPKCGMDLEPKKRDVKKLYFEETKYTCCPGCPDVVSDKPGKCPKCGMELKKEAKIYSLLCPEKKCKYNKSLETGRCEYHKMDLKDLLKKDYRHATCPYHKKKLVKTEVNLYCPHDRTELKKKDWKLYCEKCDMEIKPEEVKIEKIEKKK